eukprot:TRINITY_DN4007_c0_g1_i1.p1 TRINITY_DN4007_c0_g1~~TRINITY_DN4007_c0_g1_i1.p1  ORF type:complete len:430 (+),score=171.49 TRINITY_DN4007_c0_g1_i1:108-1292(+)
MVAAKRQAPVAAAAKSGAQSSAKARKVTKADEKSEVQQQVVVEKPVVEKQKTPLEEACERVLHLLDDAAAGDIGTEAKAMLRSAAPFALQEPSAERHRFQTVTVELISSLLENVQRSKREAEEALASRFDEALKNKESAEKQVKDAKQTEKEKSEARDGAKQSMEEAGRDVLAAKETLAAEKTKLEALQKASEESSAAKVEREKLIDETWVQLKEGMAGSQWRARNKLIDALGAVLDEIGAEDSIKLAVPVALKTKDRGAFAEKALIFAEEALRESVEKFVSDLKAKDAEVSEQSTAISSAEEKLASAQATREERESAYVVAENILLEADSAVGSATESFGELQASEQVLDRDLKAARAEQESVSALVSQFGKLAEQGAAALEAVEAVASTAGA